MTMRFIVIVVLTLFTRGCQPFSWLLWGRCPNLGVQQGFDMEPYLGLWFLQFGYHSFSGRCTRAYYKYESDSVAEVYNAQITSSNQWVTFNGTVVLDDPSKKEGKLFETVYIPIWRFWEYKLTGPYWILGTDYDNYSVVYSCNNFLFIFHYYSSWLLSREQNLDDEGLMAEYLKNVTEILKTHEIDPSIFTQIDQEDCNM